MNSFLENRPAVARKDGKVAPSKPEAGFHSLIPEDGTAPKVAKPAQMPASEAATEPSPQVELVQSGGKVDKIIVTCTCCNRIELKCQY
jgi:hypothetical protein